MQSCLCSSFSHKSIKHKGFTLLEVLIALAVLATSLVALSGSLLNLTQNQTYQQNRTLAFYVATYRLAEFKLADDTIKIGTTRGNISMFNRDWQWQQNISRTTERDFYRVEISIHSPDDPDYTIQKISSFTVARQRP
jgi:general secretion pathway protein I